MSSRIGTRSFAWTRSNLRDTDREVEIVLEDGIALTGRVTSSATGSGVARATLDFRTRLWQRRVVTDDDGEYVLSGIVNAAFDEIRVEAPGFAARYDENVVLDVSKTPRLDLQLDPAASVAGRVLDVDGLPIYKARVSLTPVAPPQGRQGGDRVEELRRVVRARLRQTARAESGLDGRFRFDRLVGDGEFLLFARHADFRVGEEVPLSIERGEQIDGVELQLVAGGRIEVMVRNPARDAVAGALVRLERQYRAEEIEARRAASEARRRGVDGRAVGQDGARRGLVNRVGRESGSRRRSATTGPDGRAKFSGLEDSIYLVAVEAEGHQRAFVTTAAEADLVATVAVDLLRESVIAGVVRDSSGAPIAGATVSAVPDVHGSAFDALGQSDRDRKRRARELTTVRTTSDAQGRFHVDKLTGVTHSLEVRAAGFAEQHLLAQDVDQHLVVTLENLGSVRVAVLLDVEGEAPPQARARLRAARRTTEGELVPPSREASRLARWRTVGPPPTTFELRDVPPGSYTMEVDLDGVGLRSSEVHVDSGAATDVRIVFP